MTANEVWAPGPGAPCAVATAVADLQAGRMVVLVDDQRADDDGDLMLAATHATPERLAFMMRHTSGILCVPMPADYLDRLQLPPMVARSEDSNGAWYTVSVNARSGILSGISAADRATTIAILADPASTPGDLNRPGHVFPLRAVEGGVLRRAGHTEAAVDLARIAGLPPVAVICEVVDDDGAPLRGSRLRMFAASHRVPVVTIAEMVAYRRRTERLVEFRASSRLPTEHGVFRACGFLSVLDGREHLALVMGDIAEPGFSPTLVHVHTECMMGNVFGAHDCECERQLDSALRMVAAEGRGVVLYLRGHADPHGGIDARDQGVSAQILAELGVRGLRLLTNHEVARSGLVAHGLEVIETLPLPA